MTFSYSNIVQLNTRISFLGARKHEWIVQGTVISQMDGLVARLNQRNTVDSCYLEIKGTLKNTSRYPYFDISDLGVPRRQFRCGFICFMFGAVQFLNV